MRRLTDNLRCGLRRSWRIMVDAPSASHEVRGEDLRPIRSLKGGQGVSLQVVSAQPHALRVDQRGRARSLWDLGHDVCVLQLDLHEARALNSGDSFAGATRTSRRWRGAGGTSRL
jgi:hypothetical protein